MNNIHKGFFTLKQNFVNVTRHVQSNASLLENCGEIINRNPRNLELMTIARKPIGFSLNKPGIEYWHRLFVNVSTKNVEAEVRHFKNGPIITVSTKEWALKRQLYRQLDVAAFANVGRVLAQRCLESGIGSLYINIPTEGSQRYTALMNELKNGGIMLSEMEMYKHANPWDKGRMIKPWTIED